MLRFVAVPPGYPVQNCPSGSFLSWGGPVGRGGIVYDIVWRGCPRRALWMMLCSPVCFRILSSFFTSVSIFSVCCYCIYSISVITTMLPMQTTEWLHLVLYFSTEYHDSGNTIIILLCKKFVDICVWGLAKFFLNTWIENCLQYIATY